MPKLHPGAPIRTMRPVTSFKLATRKRVCACVDVGHLSSTLTRLTADSRCVVRIVRPSGAESYLVWSTIARKRVADKQWFKPSVGHSPYGYIPPPGYLSQTIPPKDVPRLFTARCKCKAWSCDRMSSVRLSICKGKGKGRYSSSWEPHLRATGRHLAYGITQCCLPPDTSERAPPNPSHEGWYSIRFTYPWGMEGWVDLVDLIAPRPGVEPATFRSRLRRWTTAPPRQLSVTLVDCDHIGWKSWKLIARTIRPTSSLFVEQRPSTYSQGNTGKFGED